MSKKPVLRIEKTEIETQIEQQKAVLKALDEKAKGGEITLKDIYEQNKLIIEMLQEKGITRAETAKNRGAGEGTKSAGRGD